MKIAGHIENQQLVPSTRCWSMIKANEGFADVAYCHADGVWTIGYGHTRGVKRGDVCTHVQALSWLFADTVGVARAVRILVVVPMTQCMFDALCCLVYNIGVGAFHKSTLLADLNKGDMASVAAQWIRWDHVHGRIDDGLARRRHSELRLFQTPAI